MSKNKKHNNRLSNSELERLRQKRKEKKDKEDTEEYISRDYFTKKRLIIAGIIFTCTMVLNIISGMIDKQSILTSILLGASNTFTLLSFLTLMDTPLLTVSMMFVSQWLLIFNDLYCGYTLTEALNNAGPMEVYSWAAIPIIAIMNYKKLKNTSWKRKDQDDKIYDIIMYKRRVYKVPMWAQFVIWCMTFSLVFMSARNNGVQQIAEAKLPIKIYISLAGVIPTMAVFMRYTTTEIAYWFMGAITILRAVTLTIMGINHELKYTSVLYFILQTAIITIAIVKYIKLCKSERKTKKLEKIKKKEKESDKDKEDETSNIESEAVTN